MHQERKCRGMCYSLEAAQELVCQFWHPEKIPKEKQIEGVLKRWKGLSVLATDFKASSRNPPANPQAYKIGKLALLASIKSKHRKRTNIINKPYIVKDCTVQRTNCTSLRTSQEENHTKKAYSERFSPIRIERQHKKKRGAS